MDDSEREGMRHAAAAGREDPAALDARARAAPDDVALRLAAGGAHVRAGDPAAALAHFDAAWRLGPSAAQARDALVEYGTALGHAGRADEAVARLGEAVATWPADAALKAALALALQAAGNPHAALATMLDALLEIDAQRDVLGGHGALLARQRDALLDRAVAMA
jgi:tetratricopeptide (TPR) repeat protein